MLEEKEEQKKNEFEPRIKARGNDISKEATALSIENFMQISNDNQIHRLQHGSLTEKTKCKHV